jgi:hypothetical protein
MYCRPECQRQAKRARSGVRPRESAEIAALRRENGFKTAARRRAQEITITCTRCRSEFTTAATRSNAKFCEPCKQIHKQEEHRRWKIENPERYKANKRRNEQESPIGREGRRRRSARAVARKRERQKRPKTDRPKISVVCSTCGNPFESRRKGLKYCRAECRPNYYKRNIDRYRRRARLRFREKYRVNPTKYKNIKAMCKWRQMYGDALNDELVLLLTERLEIHRAFGMYDGSGKHERIRDDNDGGPGGTA